MASLLNKLKHSTIKNKLMIMIMFVTSITIIIMCTAFIIYGVTIARTSMISELELVSRIIGKRLAPALEFNALEQAQKHINDLKTKPSVILSRSNS